MARDPDALDVYQCVDLFRQRCLIEHTSLLWPEHSAWAIGNLNALEAAFIGKPDFGSGSFLEKWEAQLSSESDDVIRVAADLMVLYCLMPYSAKFSGAAKLGLVEAVARWRNLVIAPSERELLQRAFAKGIASTGTYYQTGRFHEISFYLLFCKGVVEGKADPFNILQCRALANEARMQVGTQVQSSLMILHLLFPDEIEAIVSHGHRETVINTFRHLADPGLDDDTTLLAIRNALSAGRSEPYFHFYLPDIRAQWEKAPTPKKQPEPTPVPSPERPARVVKIAPGHDAMYWNDCLANGIICIGWDKTGDLTQYDSLEAFLPAFRNEYSLEYRGNNSTITTKAKEVWTLRELRPGDRIVANKGISHVLGVGTVIEPGYRWDATRAAYKHTVSVEWDTSLARDIPPQNNWGLKTIADVDPDLWKLIEQGDAIEPDEPELPMVGYEEPTFDEIVAAVVLAGLKIDARTLRRYHLSLRTRKFVILSGPSGTGKTWLATAWAEAAGAKSLVVPVAPNWTTNEDLLGYLSPLTETYVDTPFSRFLREAVAEQARADDAGVIATPYHLVLDEMNLARVEYYFARFLSAMELRARGEPASIELGTEFLALPDNLVVIGTVNIDETTHGFADKVYDRAQLIELGIDRAELAAYVAGQPFAGALLDAWDCVADVKPFAFRVAREFIAYIGDADRQGIGWEEAFDEQMLQKVLPRLTGADLALGKALEALQAWSAGRYPLTHHRVGLMLDRYRHTGVASYFA
jgi:hypothetical protein